jgi:twinkle protein
MYNEINGFEVDVWNVHGFPIGGKTTGKVDTICTFCSHTRKNKTAKCATIYLDTAWFTCNHCGEKGQLHTYKRQNQTETFLRPPVALSQRDWSIDMVQWFKARSIEINTLKSLRIGHGVEWMPQTQQNTKVILFNYYLHGKLINIKYRDGKKNFKLFKGAEKIMYNLDAIIHTKDCVIVEGEIDAASYVEAGIENVVSVPNGFNLKGDLNLDYVTSCYEFFENKEKIYLALDNDEAGKKGQSELIRRFGAEKIWLVDFKDCKDANEYLIKYGKELLAKTIADATQCPLEDVRTVFDLRKRLREFYLNGNDQGYKISLNGWDEIFSTYLGQCIAVTGIPSSGKSDFVDQMCVGFNLNYQWKIAFASPENNPVEMHMDKILRRTAGFTPRTEAQLDNENWTKVEEYVDKNYFHIDFKDGYELDRTLKKIEELVLRKGIRVAVLDPFNKIRLKTSLNKHVTEYTNDYLNVLDQFARKHNIILFIVAHPTKMQKLPNGAYDEPDMYDIKGGGEWYDMMPHGIMIHRDYNRNIVKAKVLKVKFSWLGTNKAFKYFGWNVNNGRYTPIDGEVDDSTIHVPPILWDNTNWITGEQPPSSGLTEDEEEAFEQNVALPVMSASQAFGSSYDEVPDYGLSDDDFENDDDVPF